MWECEREGFGLVRVRTEARELRSLDGRATSRGSVSVCETPCYRAARVSEAVLQP